MDPDEEPEESDGMTPEKWAAVESLIRSLPKVDDNDPEADTEEVL